MMEQDTVMEKKNNAGLYRGWIKFWNRNFERWLYAMHRITGVGVGIYFVAHIWETSNAAQAFLDVEKGLTPVVWTDLMSFLANYAFHTGLLLVAAAAVFHSLNGVRLVMSEQGWLIGKVTRPTYPFLPSSLRGSQKQIGIAIVIASFVLMAFAFYQLFVVALGV
jgi:succinate dehydrogenase / fumarate reductase cytochrome b subunit